MDKSTKAEASISQSQQFRTPFDSEKAIGLWVDRTGKARVHFSSVPRNLRLLGLYGAVYIEEGSGYFISGQGEPRKTGPGNVMLLFPDEPHAYYPEDTWITKWIVWGGPESDILRINGYISSDSPVIHDRGEAFSRAYEALVRVMAHEDLGAVLRRKIIILQMVLGLYNESRFSKTGKRNSDRIEQAVQFIQDHTTEEIQIPTIASMCSMSTTHFRRLFKLHTGRSPQQYHLFLRVSAAKQLLSEGKSIKETAYSVGYEDEFYFMRVFKKHAGIPPGRFVKTQGM